MGKLLQLSFVFFVFSLFLTSEAEERSLSIAVVAPLSGESEGAGASVAHAVSLYFSQLKEKGDQYEKVQFNLKLYDDKNLTEEASKQADLIVNSNAVAVIGHNISSTTLAGAIKYSEKGIPLLVPTATNVEITRDRPWVYRLIYNDEVQSKNLVRYLSKVVGVKKVSVISESMLYGSYISQVFVDEASKEKLEVIAQWKINENSSNIEAITEEIISRVKRGEELGYIFLAIHEIEAVGVIRRLKDAGVKNRFIAPDSLSSLSFQERFKGFPLEIESPGFYTDGLMASTPYVQDIANREAQIFRQKYYDQFGSNPDWRAAYAYDCAKILHTILVEVFEEAGSKELSLEEIREGIREKLSEMRNPADGREGVTGLSYFDQNGDSLKPVTIGIFQEGKTVSALWQLKDLPNPHAVKNLSEALEKKEIINVDGNYMYKTDIVYAGVQVKKITDIDVNSRTCSMEFLLWMRYPESSHQPEDIVFTNAVGPLDEFTLVEKTEFSIYNYQVFSCRGRFYMDYKSSGEHLFNKHFAGVQFRHRNLSSSKIFYVPDLSGMSTLKKREIELSPGWQIDNFIFYKDSYYNKILGNPLYMGEANGSYEQIHFNAEVNISKEYFSLRGKISRGFSFYLAPLSFLLFASLSFLRGVKKYFLKVLLFFIKSVALLVFLLSFEVLLIEQVAQTANSYNLNITRISFDVAYWLFVSYVLIQMIYLFLFIPKERRSQKVIPKVVKGITYFIVLMSVFFIIVSFVFQRPLTGLLATSGLLAMIIGLAVQINLSNIFSGIALNLERPFQIGDWVKIGNQGEGRVVDMTWRSTRVLTRTQQTICIPNSRAAEEIVIKIENDDKQYVHGFDLYLSKDYDIKKVIELLYESMKGVEGLMDPWVLFYGSEDWANNYWVYWMAEDYATTKWPIRQEVYTRIRKNLEKNGMKFAVRNQEIRLKKEEK